MTTLTSAGVTRGPIASIGHSVLLMTVDAGEAILLMVRTFRYLPHFWTKRHEIVTQMLICGVYTLPVALLVAAFSGMVLALHAGYTLQKYGQPAAIGAITAVSMCREMGPVWVGVVLAARVGSAMAAELGTMRVSEEIDALEVMSIDPARFLVMPRLIALTLIAPALTAFADLAGIIGGAVVGKYQIGVEYPVYFRSVFRNLEVGDILGGLLIKAPVFGLIIAVVGCALGLAVKPSEGAEGVGSATRNSVVAALILLIIFNYFLASIVRHL